VRSVGIRVRKRMSVRKRMKKRGTKEKRIGRVEKMRNRNV
jgi:hypothetical protein